MYIVKFTGKFSMLKGYEIIVVLLKDSLYMFKSILNESRKHWQIRLYIKKKVYLYRQWDSKKSLPENFS